MPYEWSVRRRLSYCLLIFPIMSQRSCWISVLLVMIWSGYLLSFLFGCFKILSLWERLLIIRVMKSFQSMNIQSTRRYDLAASRQTHIQPMVEPSYRYGITNFSIQFHRIRQDTIVHQPCLSQSLKQTRIHTPSLFGSSNIHRTAMRDSKWPVFLLVRLLSHPALTHSSMKLGIRSTYSRDNRDTESCFC